MEPVLDARAVVFTHPGGGRPALDGVSLAVRPGECVALLGPNGAGKTTLVSCITGLLAPQGGIVRVAGGDPLRASTRRALGVVLQRAAFPRHLTASELVGGAAIRAGLPASAADPVLSEVGLSELANRRGGQLSGGQLQRLQLARALVTDPTLLVLDEPTVGLDGEARRRFWADLAARRDAGMAILLTTHLVEEAGAFADRVAVIAEGELVADADPRQLVNRLPDRTITATSGLDVALVRNLPGVAFAAREGGTLRVVTDAPEEVLRELLRRDLDLADLRVEGASLEEAVMVLGRSTPGPAPAVSSLLEVSR